MPLHNKKELYARRKTLRTEATPQEMILWSRLRRNQLGYKFRRQESIGWYIVDFYCFEKKLVIEVDGSQHKKNKTYDDERTQYLNTLGITVLRFWDNEIDKNIDGVIGKIISFLQSLSRPSCQHLT